MKQNKLLQKQIKRLLPAELAEQPVMVEFLKTINDSYNAYERDNELSERAFKISEEEYIEINTQLKKETELKRISINKLKESIDFVEEDGLQPVWKDNSLLEVVVYLNQQISKRKAAESKLASTANRLSALIRNMHTGILAEDENRRIVLTNKIFCEMFSIQAPPEALTGSDCSQSAEQSKHLFKDPETFIQRINQLLTDKKVVVGDELELADGRTLLRDYVPIYVNDLYQGHLWNYTDITYRKKTETELRQSSLVASANKNGVILTDNFGKVTWVNEGFSKLTGYSFKESLGNTPVELLRGPDTNIEEIRKMVTLFYTGQPFDIELICIKKDGTPFWANVKGQAVLDADMKVQQYFAIVEDISSEKDTKNRLQEMESRFKIAFEKIGDNVWEHDFATGKTFFSKSDNIFLEETLEKSSNQAELWWNSVHPEDIGLLTENDKKYKSGAIDSHSLEYRVVHKNGMVRWVLDRGVVIEKDKNGLPLKIIGTHTDITERKNSEQALRMNEEKYRSIIANMNLGLLEVDSNEEIQYANQSFCDISGYPLDELLGKKASLLFVRGENLEHIEQKNSIRKKGVSDAYEIIVKNKRGEVKWWLISGAPRYNDEGELVGSIGIHLDITEQKQLELELLEARELAEESSRTKELFLANMSHEIRTPMNAILGMSRQLQKSDLNERQQFFLNVIKNAGEHLLVIINDILDISKIESGLLQLEHIGFKLSDEVLHTMQVMHHRAEEKGIQFTHEIDSDIPEILLGDPFRLKQILLNLVSNSIKFTDRGRVTIRCKKGKIIRDKQHININVTDTGIGMDKEFLKNVFTKFLQEDKTISRRYGGTGLGMSISKQLAEMMGGTIEIESEKGKGTSVTVCIPFETGTSIQVPEKEEIIIKASALQGKKILLVEDNEMNRLVATTVLANYGPLISEVQNGLEAVEALTKNNYDLVLMDVQMPVMDGLEATARIRQEVNKTIPIIALTANAIKGESKRCLDAGMNDYVSKPFEEEELIRKIGFWLGKEVSTLAGTSTTHEVKELYSLSKLNEIGRGNKDFIKKMISLFIDQTPAATDSIKSAYTSNDFSKVKAVAHRIKPSIDNMEIHSLKSEIRQIESLAGENQSSPELTSLINHLDLTITLVVEDLLKNEALAIKNPIA